MPPAATRGIEDRFVPGNLLAGRFRITQMLGRGGMGEVYSAEDLELRETVALKVIRADVGLDEEQRARFKREIRHSRKISDPHVCRIHDLFQHTDTSGVVDFLTMELVEGETLAMRLQREGNLMPDAALPIIRQLAAGLDAAHAQSIIHRDFKPGNVLLTTDGNGAIRAVVSDFGLAYCAKPLSSLDTTLPLSTGFVGTLAYMAPEQLEGGRITQQTDVFALGLVIYEMVTGHRPFAASTPLAEAYERLTRPPERPSSYLPNLAASWEQTILRCLERLPDLRFASATAVVRALEDDPVPPLPTGPDRGVAASGSQTLEIAHVLFLDLVGYSRLPMEQQRKTQAHLQSIVRAAPDFQKAQAADCVTILPTGDGMALVFFGDPLLPVKAALAIWKSWQAAPETGLRMGIHSGPVYRMADINMNANVSGGGINVAQRIMDCGDAGHILISKSVADVLGQLGEWAGTVIDLGELRVKHGVRLRVYNLVAMDAGNRAAPRSASRIVRRNRFLALTAALTLAGLSWLALSRVPETSTANRWYLEGVDALREGTYFKAVRALERAVAEQPHNRLAHARLAEAWNELDVPDSAREEMLKANPPAGGRARVGPLEQLYLSAVHHTVTREFPQAVQDYELALHQAPESQKAQAHVDLGRALEKNGLTRQSLAHYVEAVRLSPQYAGAYLRKGIVLGVQRDTAGSEEAFRQAESLYAAASNLEGLTEVLIQRGGFLRQQVKVPQARAQLEKALQMAESVANPHQQIRVLLQLSKVAYLTGDTTRAHELGVQALEAARRDGIENLIPRGLVDLGESLVLKGNNEEAGKYFQEALQLSRRFRNPSLEAVSLFSVGSLNIRLHIPEGAAQVEEALKYFEANGYRRDAAAALLVLGRHQRDQGDLAGALARFEEQRDNARRLEDPSQIARAEEAIAGIFYRQQRYPKAEMHYRQTWLTAKSSGDRFLLMYSALQLGDTLWRLGRYQEAAGLIDDTQAIAKAGGYGVSNSIFMVRAEISLSEGKFSRANELAKLYLASPAAKQPANLAEGTCILAQARSRAGDKMGAWKECEASLRTAHQIRDPWLPGEITASCAEVAFEAGFAAKAAELAAEGVRRLEPAGKLESRWRALLVAARAAKRLGNNSQAAHYARDAAELLGRLESDWGEAASGSYSRRLDIAARQRFLLDLTKKP